LELTVQQETESTEVVDGKVNRRKNSKPNLKLSMHFKMEQSLDFYAKENIDRKD